MCFTLQRIIPRQARKSARVPASELSTYQPVSERQEDCGRNDPTRSCKQTLGGSSSGRGGSRPPGQEDHWRGGRNSYLQLLPDTDGPPQNTRNLQKGTRKRHHGAHNQTPPPPTCYHEPRGARRARLGTMPWRQAKSSNSGPSGAADQPSRQLKGLQVSKGVLQLPPRVEADGAESNRDAISDMIIVVLHAAVKASERRKAVHSSNVKDRRSTVSTSVEL